MIESDIEPGKKSQCHYIVPNILKFVLFWSMIRNTHNDLLTGICICQKQLFLEENIKIIFTGNTNSGILDTLMAQTGTIMLFNDLKLLYRYAQFVHIVYCCVI